MKVLTKDELSKNFISIYENNNEPVYLNEFICSTCSRLGKNIKDYTWEEWIDQYYDFYLIRMRNKNDIIELIENHKNK